ncbi:Hypothetical protein CINCED_3A023022 [Cinara cedri]|uniref:Uncharacterized protein n=1 Tax=Cinara cedri TaxID=506608 RepID=A0A5E4N890_9HEMI|nr:Hypothetical protein CINCED_3A023022 [Cinara cedri]
MVYQIVVQIPFRFLDDFKYTVVQTAFDTEPLQVEEPNYNNDNRDRCHAIMDKYFLRQTNGPLTAALVIDSGHKSSRFLKMCSMNLQIVEERAIGLKEEEKLALVMEITLKPVQEQVVSHLKYLNSWVRPNSLVFL